MFQFVLEAPSNAVIGDDKLDIEYVIYNKVDVECIGYSNVVLKKNVSNIVFDDMAKINKTRADLDLILQGNTATVVINSLCADSDKKVASGNFDFYAALCVWCPNGNMHSFASPESGITNRKFFVGTYGFVPYLLTPLGKFDGESKKRSYSFNIDIQHLPKATAYKNWFHRKIHFFDKYFNLDFKKLKPYIKLYPAIFVRNARKERSDLINNISDTVFSLDENMGCGQYALYSGPLVGQDDYYQKCVKYYLSNSDIEYLLKQ